MSCMGSNACGQNNPSLLRMFWAKQEPASARPYLLAMLDNRQEQGSFGKPCIGTRKGAPPMFPMKKPIRLLGMVFQID